MTQTRFVTLDPAEAERLSALGFLSDTQPALDPAEPSRHETVS